MSNVLRAVLVGQMPSGKNQIKEMVLPSGIIHKYPKVSFETWRGTGYAQLDRQRGAWGKLLVPAKIVVRYTPGDLIRRDVPGMIDALCHLLEFCPIHGKNKKRSPNCPLPFVADDSLLTCWNWETFPLDRQRARVEIEIEAISR